MDSAEALEYVEMIVSDIRDRCGLGDEWDALDDDMQTDIMMSWARILMGDY